MANVNDGEDDSRRSHRHDMLKSYYGMEGEGEGAAEGAGGREDINGPGFEAEAYLARLLRERTLTDLMREEEQMVHHIRSLDSDMQTLVYENYNKFISATDTIRKMKNDFRKMEDEMDHLAANMGAITEFSGRISSTLQDRRQQITKLAGVHTLLKKLQFLFELPSRLKKCIDMQAYSQAVSCYVKARSVLHQYEHVASFQNIQRDCSVIVTELSAKLREQFRDADSSPKQLAECVDLLLQLDEPTEALCDEFLSHARQKLDSDLQLLHDQLQIMAPPGGDEKQRTNYLKTPMDVLEFVDCGCNVFLSNMCLVIASYNDMFLNRFQQIEQLDAIALKKLIKFVNSLMECYFDYVRRRVQLENETGDNTILVRALDRFHRRLQAMNKLLPDTDFSRAGTDIVARAAHDRVAYYFTSLTRHFAACLTDVRQRLAAPPLGGGPAPLASLLQTAHASLVSQLRSVLANLRAFAATDATFAMQPYFRTTFCVTDVREGLVVAFVRHVAAVADRWCDGRPAGGATGGAAAAPPPALLLILSRLCVDFDESTVGYLLTLTDEQFLIEDCLKVTSRAELSAECRCAAQRLLNQYVRMQGLSISQMLRKSVETRDWLHTIEPRTVRAVMKRVVEDVTSVDLQVGELYEEGTGAARQADGGSDSTARRSHSLLQQVRPRANWSYAPSTIDNSLRSNIQKLFSERIEIFSAVEFSKVSVLTGIIKISLKTFLECVRLRTFSRYGLQQIQVDTHYLQMYLWRFVADENLVHFLLDEIVGSTIHRCLDPITMETSVVELICERG